MLLQSNVNSCRDVSCCKWGEKKRDGSSWLPGRGSNSKAPCKETVFQVPMLHQEDTNTFGLGTHVGTLQQEVCKGDQQLEPPSPNVSSLGEVIRQQTCQQHSAGDRSLCAKPSNGVCFSSIQLCCQQLGKADRYKLPPHRVISVNESLNFTTDPLNRGNCARNANKMMEMCN